MFRITVHDQPGALTFQVEGSLTAGGVKEVEDCRQRWLAGCRRSTRVSFDLAGLTWIDAAGKAYLAVMHRQGAEFAAADCLTRSIVAEITGAPLLDCGPSRQPVATEGTSRSLAVT